MQTPPRSSAAANTVRPRSKSSQSDTNPAPTSRPSSSRNGALTVPSSPSLPTGFPPARPTTPAAASALRHQTASPAPTPYRHTKQNSNNSNTPRKNGRRRYTPRQIPPAPFRPVPSAAANVHSASPQSTSPKPSPSEPDVAQFVTLTQQLNGQMDGLVDYQLPGGRWESGILFVDAPTCSLNRHFGAEGYQRIVADLRGSRVDKVYDEKGEAMLVLRVTANNIDVTLRPPVTDVEKWFAALYRWRTVTRSPSSKSLQSLGSNKSSGQSAPDTPTATPAPRRVLDIKIGSMLLLPSRRIKAILKDNGVLSILSESSHRGEDEVLLYSIHLYTLQRSAIQLIDPSLSTQPYCFVIHARLRESNSKSFEMRKMPIYLALDSRIQMEVWFVLLRCYAVPEVYGPPSLDPLDAFRCHRSLSLKIIEGKRLHRPVGADSGKEKDMDCYCEILIDGEIRGKTSIKRNTQQPFWSEDFELADIQEHIDDVAVHVRYIRRNRDLLLGKVTLEVMDSELGTSNQEWHPVIFTARDGLSVERVGELEVRFKLQELPILMSSEYDEIKKLLLDFSTGLTLEIARTVQDLDAVADRLVHIFIAENVAVDWLTYLADDEITAQFTNLKPLPISADEPNQVHSEDAEAHQQQILKQEATRTLFRGNTLLTKSLMKFMEKVGKDYLEETLGPYLRFVVANASLESCEVDPAHLKSSEDLDDNWRRLLGHIRRVWDRILNSASSCPPEFKIIFSRIQEKVIAAAGNIPAITFARYTCISAFIFLRFFMPACLNPSICGIIRQPPDETQRRTLLLISKGLQGVSNMSGYGGKEKWILPMATLSAEYEDRFTAFIDEICDTTSIIGPRQPAQYGGPALVKSRLDPLSQEGIPTLPFLIDEPREFAGLVKVWNRQLFPPVAATGKQHHSIDVAKLSEAGRSLHSACVQLNIKTLNLVETAVEREDEELSETEAAVVEDEIVAGVAEISIASPISPPQSGGSMRLSKKEIRRRSSFAAEEGDYSASSPKRALDAMWPGIFRKRPGDKDKTVERDRS